jgi:hypothetical protein
VQKSEKKEKKEATPQPSEVATLRTEVAPTDLASVEPRTDN